MINGSTGFVNFNQRAGLAQKLKKPIQGIVKESLYKPTSPLYTPQTSKLAGYTQFPRPRAEPYANQYDPCNQVIKNMVAPKKEASLKTLNKLVLKNELSQKRPAKMYGETLSGTITDYEKKIAI